MKYDEIIEGVGGCGLYQKFILTLLYTVPLFDGLQIGSLMFIVPEINHRCTIPRLPNDTYELQDTNHADLITTYIPQHTEDGERTYRNCYFYSNETLDDNGTMHACNSWVYDKSQYQTSVTSDVITEITSMKYRARQALALQIGYPFAFILISLFAFFIRVWRLLMILISAPLIPLALLMMWFVPESPRWLMSVMRVKQAGKVLNKMAEINKSNFRYAPKHEIETSNSNDRNVKIWKIFTVRDLLKRNLILMFAWGTMIFVYYGLTQNIGVLAGNVYLNLLLSCLVEISVILFAVVVVDRFGRKKLTFSFMVTSGITGILTLFPYLYASKDQFWTITALTKFSRMCISGLISVIYLYTCELYPTSIRNSSVGFFGAFARFGGILSPYIMNISNLFPGRVGKSLPLMVMGITCLVSGILIIFLPETTNKPMKDTFDEVIKSKYANNSACKEDELDETVELNAVA